MTSCVLSVNLAAAENRMEFNSKDDVEDCRKKCACIFGLISQNARQFVSLSIRVRGTTVITHSQNTIQQALRNRTFKFKKRRKIWKLSVKTHSAQSLYFSYSCCYKLGELV